MADQVTSYKRDIIKTNKFSLELFLYRPKGFIGKSHNRSINVYPILHLRPAFKSKDYNARAHYKTNSFKITPKNIYKVVKFFNIIIGWFRDPEKKDLFMINEDDELIFNADYNSLDLTLAGNYFDGCYMKALPAVIIENDKREEGIYLYINDTTEVIELITSDVELIFNILYHFSFTEELNSILLMEEFLTKHKLWEDESQGPFNKIPQKTAFD